MWQWFVLVSRIGLTIQKGFAEARVVINQSRGNDFLAPYRELYPHIFLRDLPELEELQSMINDLPLDFVSFQSDLSAYLVALEVILVAGASQVA